MILTDTGPLVALLDRKDPNRPKCVEVLKQFPSDPLLTTWPCVTEAMHLLYRDAGYQAQAFLWEMYKSERLAFHNLGDDEIKRTAMLMDKYRDTPMDLADASLVASAETLGLQLIFTLDGDFRIYRLADGSALDIVP
ncbi:MAG: PIN domain-containing protein [Planctomycetes bacterium]|nr:PIN domain-containing protein [Planctomycetota bacterium]